MEDNITTIRARQSTVEELRNFEIHPRETNEEIILRLIDEVKKKESKK